MKIPRLAAPARDAGISGVRSSALTTLGITVGDVEGWRFILWVRVEWFVTLLRYSPDRMLVLKQGTHPIEAARVPYWFDHTLQGLWRAPRCVALIGRIWPTAEWLLSRANGDDEILTLLSMPDCMVERA